LFTTNSTVANNSSQFLCLYSVKNHKYCFNTWLIYSICPSVCRWNIVDNLVSIPNILFNSFVNSTANCSSLLLITFSGNLCNFYTLFLNNLANPSTDVSSIVTTKCAVLTTYYTQLILHLFPPLIAT